MTCKRPASVEAMCLQGEFETIRKVLLADCYAPHRQRPLSDWVENGDRRLPLPFLSRSVGEILQTPFETLRGTPGVGQRKLRTLICLLERVRATPPQVLCDRAGATDATTSRWTYGLSEDFDPHKVSDVLWEQWRQTVCRLGIEDEPLGRFAGSLRSLVRTLWWQPLRQYMNCTLAELHKLRVHGERRINSILEVFYHIHQLARDIPADTPLSFRLAPRAILKAESWVARTLTEVKNSFTLQALQTELVAPLLAQLRADAKPILAEIAQARLESSPGGNSIRQIARRFQLTRARIYQLLHEIAEIVHVRWPTGRYLVRLLRDRLQQEHTLNETAVAVNQLNLCLETFFGEGESGDQPTLRSRRKNDVELISTKGVDGQAYGAGQQGETELLSVDQIR